MYLLQIRTEHRYVKTFSNYTTYRTTFNTSVLYKTQNLQFIK